MRFPMKGHGVHTLTERILYIMQILNNCIDSKFSNGFLEENEKTAVWD